MKASETVRKNTLRIALGSAVLSLLEQAVFLVIGKWDITVLCGNTLIACAGVLNFYLLGKTLDKAMTRDEKDSATMVRGSQSLRLLMMAGFLALGALLPDVFNLWSLLPPIFFNRITIFVYTFISGKKEKSGQQSEGKQDG